MRKGEVTVRAQTVRTIRKIRGFTQFGLAEAATEALRVATGDNERSISESLIALIETNRRQPSRENGEAIAAALEVPFDAIGDVNFTEEGAA